MTAAIGYRRTTQLWDMTHFVSSYELTPTLLYQIFLDIIITILVIRSNYYFIHIPNSSLFSHLPTYLTDYRLTFEHSNMFFVDIPSDLVSQLTLVKILPMW